MCCLPWDLNQELSTPQPRPQQSELPLPTVVCVRVNVYLSVLCKRSQQRCQNVNKMPGTDHLKKKRGIVPPVSKETKSKSNIQIYKMTEWLKQTIHLYNTESGYDL